MLSRSGIYRGDAKTALKGDVFQIRNGFRSRIQKRQKNGRLQSGEGMDQVTVLIPTWRPGEQLNTLLKRLSLQTLRPKRVLILNTVEKGKDDPVSTLVDQWRERFEVLSVFHVEKTEFDHGGTRNLGFVFSDTELVLCMTQDAIPRDKKLIERLAACFDDPEVAVSYGRQLAMKGCSARERYTRQFNYPDRSVVKSKEDLKKMGIKTFFCSDVCAMWRRDVYFELGGFEHPAIFNEDMVLAGKLIENGWKIAYEASAAVWHSHSYPPSRQLKRNFDLGVSQEQHPELFARYPSEGEGIRLVKKCAAYLVSSGHAGELFLLAADSACKYLGYRLGKSWRRLPKHVILRLTDNPSYWTHVKKNS